MFKIRYIGDFKAVHYKWCKFHYFWLLQDLKLIIIWYISFVNSSKPNLLSLLNLTKKMFRLWLGTPKIFTIPTFCYIHVSTKSVLVYILPFLTWHILFTLTSVIYYRSRDNTVLLFYPSSIYPNLGSNSRGT